ncbi:hypothetical protein [Microcoleus sp. FACHB-831]|nr:hypothetical protein [Microcoleus sp. FACHB-831]
MGDDRKILSMHNVLGDRTLYIRWHHKHGNILRMALSHDINL